MSVRIDRDFTNHLAQVTILVNSNDVGVATDMLKALETAAIDTMDAILTRKYPNDYYDYEGFA